MHIASLNFANSFLFFCRNGKNGFFKFTCVNTYRDGNCLNVAQTKFEIPYLSFPPSEIDFALPAKFTLPCRLLPIIVARRQERTICHILDKFIDKVVAFLRI